VPEPLNAVYGVTVAAATFAVKAVVDPEMPVSHGFYRVVSVDAPVGSIVNPLPPAPVAGDNVETALRIVGVVLKAPSKALPGKVPAASRGAMPNAFSAKPALRSSFHDPLVEDP
jgi:N-methylhydantoinase B